jgi:hypothetical protein
VRLAIRLDSDRIVAILEDEERTTMLPANSNDTKRYAGQTVGRVKYGSKYEQGVDVAEIAKRVRKDIAGKIRVGELPAAKYSVRISRYSGGRSLNVYVDLVPFRIVNEERVKQDVLEAWGSREMLLRRTPEAREVIAKIEALVEAYNFDGSDSQTDYFHVNFYATIDFGKQENTEWTELRAKYEAEKWETLAPERAANQAKWSALREKDPVEFARECCPASHYHNPGSGCSLCE